MASETFDSVMEIAYKVVERDALAATQAQDRPTAILLGGQPGSGKSVLAARAMRELHDQGGAVQIDADQLRELNPRYKQLSRDNPQHAADLTQKEAGEWAARLTRAAAENRRNLVVDGTMRSPENIRNLATRLKENGYEVEARAMAVSAETSLVRAQLRFEREVARGGTGRAVNRAQHDEAYAGMAQTVATLEHEKLVDSMRLYDAQHRPIYENRQERGEWQHVPGAARSLDQERVRQRTPAEQRDHVSVLDDIHALADKREGIRDQITYTVRTVDAGQGRDFNDVNEAARAFHDAKAEERPHVIRTVRQPDGQEFASMPAQTSMVERDGKREYGKWVGDSDPSLKQAYEEATRLSPPTTKLDAASEPGGVLIPADVLRADYQQKYLPALEAEHRALLEQRKQLGLQSDTKELYRHTHAYPVPLTPAQALERARVNVGGERLANGQRSLLAAELEYKSASAAVVNFNVEQEKRWIPHFKEGADLDARMKHATQQLATATNDLKQVNQWLEAPAQQAAIKTRADDILTQDKQLQGQRAAVDKRFADNGERLNHARAIEADLKHLGADQVHVVQQSVGKGLAKHLALPVPANADAFAKQVQLAQNRSQTLQLTRSRGITR